MGANPRRAGRGSTGALVTGAGGCAGAGAGTGGGVDAGGGAVGGCAGSTAGASGRNGATGPNSTTAAVACRATSVSAAVTGISGQIQQHHDRVFLILRIIVRADADRSEAEST